MLTRKHWSREHLSCLFCKKWEENKLKFLQQKILPRKSPLETEKTVLEKPVKKSFHQTPKRTIYSDVSFRMKLMETKKFQTLSIHYRINSQKTLLLKVQKLIKLYFLKQKKPALKKLSHILLWMREADLRTPTILSLLNVRNSFYRDHFEKKRLSGKKQSPLRTLSSTFFTKVRKTSYNWTFTGNKTSKPLFWKRISLF